MFNSPVENPPSTPLADAKKPPGWEEVVDKIEFQQCAVYWRRGGGEYGLAVTKLEYSEAALDAKREAVQVATYLRPVGSDGETRIAAQATCLLPNGVTALEELKGYLTGIFPPAPKEEEEEEGPQARPDPDPPCARHAGNPDPCPEIVVTGHANPTCELGFDWDEESDSCVPNFVGGGTTTPGATPGGGTPGSSAAGGPNDNDDNDDDEEDDEDEDEDEEEPACTDDQIAIADEYNDPVNWPCTKFSDAVTEGTGTHNHTHGYIDSRYDSGHRSVVSGVGDHGITGVDVSSDWRCPIGNADVGGKPNSQHKWGLAGDFHADEWSEVAWRTFADIAHQTGSGWNSGYGSGGNCPEGLCYLTYIHIDWR